MVTQVNVNKLTGKGAAKGVAEGLIKVAILDVMSRWCVDKKKLCHNDIIRGNIGKDAAV